MKALDAFPWLSAAVVALAMVIVVAAVYALARLAGRLSQRAWDFWDAVYTVILDLEPTNGRQEALRTRMLNDIETISESRNLREAEHDSGLTALFWIVVFFGVGLVLVLDRSFTVTTAAAPPASRA